MANKMRPRQLICGSWFGFCLRWDGSFGGVSGESDMTNTLENSPKSLRAQWQTLPPSQPPLVSGLVVSIHDVCPGTREATEKMLSDLARAGVERASLLVIPNRHRRDPAFADAGFCRWLREKAGQGHELVLHGYYHQRMAREEPRGYQRWMARHYTAGEGEFYDNSEEEARAGLERGLLEMSTALGRAPEGFIAPAWLLGPAARRALLGFDFSFTTLLSGVWDLREECFYRSQSLCYSVRAAWRRVSSLGWNSALLAWLDDNPLVRLGLHPPDWDYPCIRRHILTCARWALTTRPASTYEGWLRAQRGSSLTAASGHPARRP